jgi:hypothetical protein
MDRENGAMLAQRLSKYVAARNAHYSWVVAALTFFYILFSSSAVSIPSVLIRPMADELGLTIGELSAAQGVRFALFGLVAPFAGGLMMRYGPRRMVVSPPRLRTWHRRGQTSTPDGTAREFRHGSLSVG